MQNHYVPGSVSAALLTSPAWAELIHVYSTTMYLLSITTGAVVGCITLYKMWKQRKDK